MYNPIKLDYSSLEPYIDNETLNTHYNNHYLKYLNNLNSLLKKNNYTYQYTLSELVDNIDIFPLNERGEILYNLGGVLNHNLYFYTMSNKKNNIPTGNINKAIIEEFKTYDNFKKEFIDKALNLKGSGYTFLVLNRNNRLFIINTSNQDTPYSYGLKPLLALDLWEHSYYLKYKSNKEEYIENWFNLIDFNKVNTIYDKIKKP